MTREEADFIGAMNMCDEISNEAYKKIMCHCEEQQPCEDCISRQAVLDVIEREEFKGDAISEIEKLSSVTPKAEQKWIPCTERLPEDDGWYLCTIQKETETKVAQIRFFENTKWKAYGWNVIAWMNEPQPYKAESEKINCKSTKCENCFNHNYCDFESEGEA